MKRRPTSPFSRRFDLFFLTFLKTRFSNFLLTDFLSALISCSHSIVSSIHSYLFIFFCWFLRSIIRKMKWTNLIRTNVAKRNLLHSSSSLCIKSMLYYRLVRSFIRMKTRTNLKYDMDKCYLASEFLKSFLIDTWIINT